MTGSELVICARCGTRRDPHGDPVENLSWVLDQNHGRHQWWCPRCARAHVRDIEGKLPSEYW
ncbi:hypothetical protein SAMN05421810_101970 [Amycolatopsis arida]|uniref:Uncharacterized protein n=1 Tax=Amycolatopsis arida TaxID=587909 RepID=A0A1I5MMW8_9PSEU|nr:hypothetical protein CLV69_104602 [Amycolatopsis arida]SFP10880.1 hypothetical protein SAMN05421810_101970 [Amycolatopsis arida]